MNSQWCLSSSASKCLNVTTMCLFVACKVYKNVIVCVCVCVCVYVLCLSLLVEIRVSTCNFQDGPYASKELARTNNKKSHKSNVKVLFRPTVHSSPLSKIAPFSLKVPRPHSLVVLILLTLR